MIHVNAGGELFQSLVELKVKEAPQGVTATFDRKWITAGATATLKVAVAKGKVLPGSYKLTVEGEAAVGGGMVRREAVLTLQVKPLLRTALTGRVLSTEMEPIPGATVSLDGRSATTDGAGMFVLEGIEAGQNRPVMVDGRTATAPNRTYPVIVEPATVIFNRANTVPYTFFLPAIDTQYEVPVAPGQETVVTTPRVPGLKLTIPAEANLRNRDGSPVTRVSLTPVAIDRTPAPLPAGINLTMVFTAQPGGADSDVAMPVSFPNLTAETPGTSFSLWNFNHDSAQWEVYGTGHVSPDGRTIEPDINPSTGKPFGLPYFSWGGPGTNLANDSSGPGPGGPFPGGPGDPANCPSCSSDNPVNFATGFKVETETDFGWGGARGGLSLTRTHLNTQAVGRFGLGWSDNWTMTVSDSRDGFAASISVSGQNRPWLFSLARTEEIEGAVEPVKVYQNTQQAGMLGDELKYYPERIQNGTNEPAFWEYRSKGGTKLRFNQTGRWETMSDRNGNTTVLSYDERGRLVKVTDPVGRWMEFTYRPAGRTTGTENQVIAVTDVMQRRWEYQYGPDQGDALNPDFNAFLLLSVTDPLGHTMRYEYIALARVFGAVRDGGRLKQVIDKRGNIVKDIEYESGGTGRVISQKFADGGVERYSYTVAGGQVTGVTITDPMGRVTSRRFNTAGYVIETTDELGQVRRVEREIGTNLPIELIGPNGVSESRRLYNKNGETIEIQDILGHKTTFDYEDKYNNIVSMTDTLNKKILREYDSNGNWIKLIDSYSQQKKFFYDELGQLIGIEDENENKTQMDYDSFGNLIRLRDSLGYQIEYTYNVLGWITLIKDPIGRTQQFEYDLVGNQLSFIDPTVGKNKYEYDENGNKKRIIDDLNRVLDMEYDSKNRLIKRIDPLGRQTVWSYNYNDELISLILPSNRKIQYQHDQRGFLISTLDSGGTEVKYIIDSKSNLIQVINQRHFAVTYFYDRLNRLIKVVDQQGKSIEMKYDVEGKLIERKDKLGIISRFKYDDLERVIEVAYPDDTISYEYDKVGRRTKVTDSQGGEIRWKYDSNDRIVEEITPNGVIQYNYNEAGQRVEMKISGHPSTFYEYDSLGRLESLSQGQDRFSYAYDSISRIVKLTSTKGMESTFEYDAVNNTKKIRHSTGKMGLIEQLDYTYSLDDEVLSISSSNEQQIELPLDKAIGIAAPANQINQFDKGAYEYDDAGRPTVKVETAGITHYEWDSRHRLVKVNLPNQKEIQYSYDALGRMTTRACDGQIKKFLYDQKDVIVDTESNGNKVLYLNDLRVDVKLKQSEGSKNYYYFRDKNGSTTVLTDENGEVIEKISYEPFGNSKRSKVRFGFTGREGDQDTGLYFFRARWYNPEQGRFLTEDPLDQIVKLNLYLYASNNPNRFTDPFGLQNSL
ncbi:MAG TPA: RHS repeat-associated core domain-containing protein [Acidobacteriota bacterium]|nr:RHS repeat-associated core domain-containing protein [Acidobacteriota bacterium]